MKNLNKKHPLKASISRKLRSFNIVNGSGYGSPKSKGGGGYGSPQ